MTAINLRLLILALLAVEPSTAPSTRPATEPTTHPAGDVRFVAPAGWKLSTKGDVRFFDAPDRPGDQTCRIATGVWSMPIRNRQGGGSFAELFDLIRQPDPILETSGTKRDKDPQGRDVLRVDKRVSWHGHETWRTYYAIHEQGRFGFVLFQCSSKDMFDKHVNEFDAFARSMDIDTNVPPRKDDD